MYGGMKMKNVFTRDWWRASLTRAVRTMCQTAIATIGTSTVMGAVDWRMVASASALAAILSMLTSLAGLPECQDKAA